MNILKYNVDESKEQYKKSKDFKYHRALILAACITAFASITAAIINNIHISNKYTELDLIYDKLQIEYNTIKTEYVDLQDELLKVKSENLILKLKNNSDEKTILLEENNKLVAENEILIAEREANNEMIRTLQVKVDELEKTTVASPGSEIKDDITMQEQEENTATGYLCIEPWSLDYHTVNVGQVAKYGVMKENFGILHEYVYSPTTTDRDYYAYRDILLNGEFKGIKGTILRSYDMRDSTISPKITISADGQTMGSYSIDKGKEPISFDISLENVKVLRITIYNAKVFNDGTATGGINDFYLYK